MKLKLAKQLKTKLSSSQSDQGTNRPMVRDSHNLMSVGVLIGFAILGATISVTVHAADYTYSIIYDDNVVSSMPTDVNDGKAVGGEFSLSGNTPKRSGYKFLGWCNALPTTTDDTDSCSGTTYQSEAGITITSATNFHLYAMWGEPTSFDKAYAVAGASKWNGYYKMQDMTANICASVDDLESSTLIDSRDSKTYTVAKINGACWMTQNLAIEPGTTMTSSDTNISASSYTLPGSGYDLKDNSASGGNCYGEGYNASTAKGNGWTNACTHVANDTDVSDAGSSACNGSTCTKEQLGAWYNYAAATAGTITGTSNSTVDTYNICPKGWTLPANGTGTGQIGSVTSYKDAFSPLYGGYYSQGSHIFATTYGFWWSATANNGWSRYSLYYYNGSLSTNYLNYRYSGYYVRCVRTS